MKLTVQHVFDALPVITNIIRENRPMPQKGKYRLARLHAKLLPEYATAAEQRDGMIKAYDFPLMVPPAPSAENPMGDGPKVPSGEFTVPPEKLAEFNAAWAEVAKEEIEVDVQPIPFAQLDLGDDKDGSISASELVILGDLVAE